MAKKGNLLYAQSGGPTSVINSSAYGVFKEAEKRDEIGQVYVALGGVQGLLEGRLSRICLAEKRRLALLTQTPGAAFGSCRKMLADFKEDEADYLKIKEILEQNGIRYFLYNGGNDSMDTVSKLSSYFKKISFPCSVIGIPKTIDNDLAETDHTPGYGSAAKYIANTFASIAYDASAYEKGRANIIEIMGRDTGWLTASAALARLTGYGPDLIYVPEVPFSRERFAKEIQNIYRIKNRCFVAVSEGIKDKEGHFISETSKQDVFGHQQLGGVSAYLASLSEECGIHARGIELNLAQRSASYLASKTDIAEAIQAGSEAVKAAVQGLSGFMVAFERVSSNPYKISYTLKDVKGIAGKIRYLPSSFLLPEEEDVSEAFISYALPLIQGERPVKTEKGLIKFFQA
jgi:6-phosphofructokinase